jgi:acetyl esterase
LRQVNVLDAIRPLEPAISRLLAATPTSVNRLIAGRPVEIDGQVLDPDAQALLRLLAPLAPREAPASIEAERADRVRAARLARGRPFPVGSVEHLTIAGAAGPLDARLYRPDDEPAPLLVYFHGGGYVVGDLDTHDQVCRFICGRARHAVLSVAYRRAPEHPFPAAVDDGAAAFADAVERARELGGQPGGVAVGGDSAGAGIAAAVCLLARDAGAPLPTRQLLIYPWCDLSRRRRSHELFGEGFYLTNGDIDRWSASYAPADPADPRASPLRAGDLSGLSPAHVLVAGFDPLRDEGLELAERLGAAGNQVSLTLASGMFHGFVNAAGISARFRQEFERFARTLG